jgi:SAM-dependent methyltransferase
LTSAVDGLTFVRADARELSLFADGSVESLSSLHAVEHIGLGRYGDSIDAAGWTKAIREFARVLAPGGRLYFSVPIGRERVEFNSQRVFAPSTIVEASGPLSLASFACVPEDGALHNDITLDDAARLEYGCGLFEFAGT